MSQQFSAFTYPDYIFKPTTSDEVQELKDNPRFHTWYKGHLTRSEIYERLLPDGESAALRIDGPSDSAIVLDSKGCLRLITGERNNKVLVVENFALELLDNNSCMKIDPIFNIMLETTKKVKHSIF
jgi:hypothetical protein